MDVQLIPPRLTVTRQKGARNDCSGTKSLGQPGKNGHVYSYYAGVFKY